MKYVPKITDKEIEENYNLFEERQTFYKEKGLDFQKNRQFLFEKIGRLKGKILEIGPGKGKTAISLVRAGYDIVVIDTDEGMLKTTALNLAYKKLLGQVEFYIMDAYALEFQENSFSNIFMVEVLHHIENINGVFEEIDRVLTKGGIFILADFNENGMKIVDQVHKEAGNVHKNSFVGKETAKKWLIEHGYGIKEHEDTCQWAIVAKKRIK